MRQECVQDVPIDVSSAFMCPGVLLDNDPDPAFDLDKHRNTICILTNSEQDLAANRFESGSISRQDFDLKEIKLDPHKGGSVAFLLSTSLQAKDLRGGYDTCACFVEL